MLKTRYIYIIGCDTDIDQYKNLYIRKPKKCHVANWEYIEEIKIVHFSDLFVIMEEIHNAENFYNFMRGYIGLFDKHGFLI